MSCRTTTKHHNRSPGTARSWASDAASAPAAVRRAGHAQHEARALEANQPAAATGFSTSSRHPCAPPRRAHFPAPLGLPPSTRPAPTRSTDARPCTRVRGEGPMGCDPYGSFGQRRASGGGAHASGERGARQASTGIVGVSVGASILPTSGPARGEQSDDEERPDRSMPRRAFDLKTLHRFLCISFRKRGHEPMDRAPGRSRRLPRIRTTVDAARPLHDRVPGRTVVRQG